jgi:hypothetical protein
MKTSGLILSAAILAAAPAFCGEDTSKLPAPAKKENVTYEKDIKPIFEQTCTRCHGADRQKGGLRLDSLEAVLKGGEDGKVVAPKDSSKSPLVIAVAQLDPDTAMPPKRGPGPGGRRGPGGQGGGPGGPGFGQGDRPPGPPPGGAPPEGGPGPGGPGPGGFGGPGGPGGRGPGGPPPKPLTTEQVALIRAWIDQGAK